MSQQMIKTNEQKTVLITGASSGIGRATAALFRQRGWNVAATMRSPDSATANVDPALLYLRLDVTDTDSIQGAIAHTLARFGRIDAVVNNAGYALTGPFETCAPEQIERQFATNVFGLMAVTRAVLPHFRAAQQGVIINISSIGGRLTFPLYSAYHASKWAVEGFSESLLYELRPFNIRVRLIEPGPIQTDFYSRSASTGAASDITAYDDFTRRVMPRMTGAGKQGSPPEQVAATIFQATIDSSWRLRYPTGGNAGILLGLRQLLPDGLFRAGMRQIFTR